MSEAETTAETVAEPLAAAPSGPSPVVRALTAACDAGLMVAALLAGWWAWDGAGVTRTDRPAWQIADTAAGGEAIAVKMERQQPWQLNERPIAHDGELAAAAHGAARSAKITAGRQVLFAQVARALELLGREGIRSATLNVVD